MQNQYTAVIRRDGDWWIGWIEEVPGVNCQEPTKEGLLETLRVTLREALDLNRDEAIFCAPGCAVPSGIPLDALPSLIQTDFDNTHHAEAFGHAHPGGLLF